METFLRCLVLSLPLLLSACSLTAKNDYFTLFNRDSHFTHGTEFAREAEDYRLAVGQNIYTPESKKRVDVVKDERPYAGYIYGNYEKYDKVDDSTTLLHGVELGLVGPGARAGQTQCKVHSLLGQGCPAGWANQLRNEPGVTLRGGIDSTSHIQVLGVSYDTRSRALLELGNISTALQLSNTLRYDLTPFLFLDATPRVSLVARDIFLDGNTWQSSHSVHKKPVCYEMIGTLGIRIDPVLIEWSLILQSPRYREQDTSYNLGIVRISLRE